MSKKQMKKKKNAGTAKMKQNAGTQPVFLFVLFQIVAFLTVYSMGRGTAYLYMLAPLAVIVFGGWILVYLIHAETAFFLNAALLLTFGTMIQCMLMSEDVIPKTLMMHYIAAAVVGVIAGFLYKRLPIIASARGTMFFLIISVLFYVLTLLLGAAAGDGVTNWLSVGSFTFQPSEFNKGIYVLILAGLLCTKENPGRKRISVALLITLINLGFLGMQGEFGTFLLILCTFLCMVFLFVPDIRVFGGIFAFLAGCCAAVVGLCALFLRVTGGESNIGFLAFGLRQIHKIQNRFIYWLDPTSDAQGGGYQILQARKALLNSNLFGSETTTSLINPTNDMVFPALTERCGLLIALTVCLLFGLLLIRGTRVYFNCTDRYHQAVAAGLTIQLILQAFIIIGGSIGLLPLTGITLPLISRGGSSLMSTFVFLAVILVISSGNLWDGRRDYSDYALKLQKKSSMHSERLSALRHRFGRRPSVDDAGESGES
ncbi:MAG: FtsW/RodA/SpoVE family cell cycle protein [Eubacteriales bacterium]|nr:FtsW/RodA/SpoVE family cell cycle protein [Eubacteriales bacterium]